MNAYVFMHECSNLFLAFICQKEGRITAKVFKSMRLDRIHSRLLKDLANVTVGLLSVTYGDQGRPQGTEKRPTLCPPLRKARRRAGEP